MNRQKHILVLFAFLLLGVFAAEAQVKIGNNPSTIASTSVLELESDSLTFVLPRMTSSDRNAIIGTPLEGSLIYNTTENCVERFNGTSWHCLVSSNVDLNIGDDNLDLAQDRTLNLNAHMLTFKDAVTGDILVLDHSNGQLNFSVYGNAVPEFLDPQPAYILGVNSDGDVVELRESDIFAGGVHWDSITNIPPDIADGDDDNQTVDVWALTGTTLNLSLEDDGTATYTLDLGGTFATDAELAASDLADEDKDSTNEIQDLSSADGSIDITQTGIDYDIVVDVSALTGDGDITSSDLDVTGGTNATLNDVNLEIKADAVTSVEIADDAVGSDEIIDDSVKPEDLEGSTAEYMMTTDASGNPQWESQASVIAELEALTTIAYDATDHEIDYVDEDGQTTVLDLNVGSISYDAVDHELDYVAEDGTPTNIALDMGAVSYNASTNELTYTRPDGSSDIINLNESSTSQAANGDITHSDEAGGSQVSVILSTDAMNDISSGSDKGNYLDVQAKETTTEYVDSTMSPLQHAIGSYTNEDTVNVTVNETLTQVLNPNSVSTPLGLKTISTYKDEAGDETDIDETVTSMINTNTTTSLNKHEIAKYVNEDGTETKIRESVIQIVYDDDDEELEFVDEEGNDYQIPINIYGRNGDLTGNRFVDFDGNKLTFENNNTSTPAIEQGDLFTFEDNGELELNKYINTSDSLFYDGSPANHVLTVTATGDVRQANVTDLETTTNYSDSTDSPKHLIGEYINEDSVAQKVYETVTDFDQNNTTGIITYKDEDGYNATANVTSADADQDLQVGTYGGTYLNVKGDVDVDGSGDFQIQPAKVGNLELAINAVESDNIVDGEVKTADLDADAVTNAKLADDAVNTENIKDGEVMTADLANTAVTAAKINSDVAGVAMAKNGTTGKLDVQVDGNTVLVNTSNELYVDGTALTAGAGDLTSSDLVITPTGNGTASMFKDVNLEIAAGAVGNTELAADAVESGNILDGEVKTADIGDGEVKTADIGDGEVMTADLADNAVTPAKIAGATAEYMLTTDASGDPIWESQLSIVQERETNTYIDNLNAGKLIGRYHNEDGTPYDIDETITTLGLNSGTLNSDSLELVYTNEDGSNGAISLQNAILAGETNTTYTDATSAPKNKIGDYQNEDGTVYEVNENLTAYTQSAPATGITATNKIGEYQPETGTAQDVEESVTVYTDAAANNTSKVKIGDYLNEAGGTPVDIKENLTELSLDQTITSPGYNRDLDYLDENGDLTSLDFTDLVDNLETVTVLTYDDGTEKLWYTNEDDNLVDLAVNIFAKDGDLKGDRWVDFNNNTLTFENNLTSIDLVQFEPTGELVLNQYDGAPFYDGDPDNNVLQVLSDGSVREGNITDLETTTTYDDLVAPADAHQIGTYTNEDGSDTAVNETITILAQVVTSGNEIANYENEVGGTPVKILETITEITPVVTTGNEIATYANEDGTTSDVSIKETVTTLAWNSADSTKISYDNEDGTNADVDLQNAILAGETNTYIDDLIAGNLIGTYHNEDGTEYEIDETVTAYSNTSGATHKIGEYQPETGAAQDVKETVTAVNQTVTSGNKIAEYVDEDGGTPTDILETVTAYNDALGTAAKSKIGDYDYEGAGTNTDVYESVTTLAWNSADSTKLSYDNEDGSNADVDLQNAILAGETNTYMDDLIAGNHIGTYHNEDGTEYEVDETITSVSQTVTTGNEIATYANEDGSTTAVSILETVTTLALNTGTLNSDSLELVYTNEDGSNGAISLQNAILAGETNTTYTDATSAPKNKIGDYQNEDGTVYEVNENLTAYTQSAPATGITATNKIGEYQPETGTAQDVEESVTVYTDAPATNTSKVKIGDYLNEAGGTPVDIKENLTYINNALITGNKIGAYYDENGDSVVLRESISSLSYDYTSEEFVFTDEAGNVNDFYANIYGTDGDLISDREINLNTHHLTIEDAITGDVAVFEDDGSVDLSQYGSGTFTGTPAYNLSVDASGNVIETDPAEPTTTFVRYSSGFTTAGFTRGNTFGTDIVDVTTATLAAGTYEVTINYGSKVVATTGSGNAVFQSQFDIDGSPAHTTLMFQSQELVPTGNVSQASRSYYVTYGSAQTMDLNLRVRTNTTGFDAEIRDIEIVVKRVD